MMWGEACACREGRISWWPTMKATESSSYIVWFLWLGFVVIKLNEIIHENVVN